MWNVKQKRGNVTQTVFESGGMRIGGQITYNGRDPMGDQGEADLNVAKGIWAVVMNQIAQAQASNQPVPFDITTDRFKRGMASLEAATSKFDPK